jgi:hypothetical protein
MNLNTAEKMALVEMVSRFKQMQFEAFLAEAALPDISYFSSNLLAMPLIVLAFSKWLDDNPHKLVTALNALIQKFPAVPSTGLLREACLRSMREASTTTPLTPWEAQLVEGVPVVNRIVLRKFLAKINSANGPKVVIVNGPRGTGRTHSFYLIKHVAVHRGIPLVRINLDWIAPQQRNLKGIVSLILSTLKMTTFITPSDTGVTSETLGVRYAENFADAFRQLPVGHERWLIFDSLELHRVPEVNAFICTLVTMRLRQDLADCTFFLLDAGPSYAFSDPHLLIATDPIGIFSTDEIAAYAGRLNALGQTPLEKSELDARTSAITKLLGTLPDHQVCAEIGKKFAELRDEVNV